MILRHLRAHHFHNIHLPCIFLNLPFYCYFDYMLLHLQIPTLGHSDLEFISQHALGRRSALPFLVVVKQQLHRGDNNDYFLFMSLGRVICTLV